ncbi:MAG: hypothetical protein HOP31_08990 [Ignavibacteria bacterium]|nr:hypothetical protein [Ignavibacteria bacterium]
MVVDKNKIKVTSIEDIDYKDYPDFCNAFIASATDVNGRELSDNELDEINQDSQFVHEQVHEYIH